MKLVLDTSALWHRPLLDALGDARLQGAFDDGRLVAILPAVAYAERLRQLARDDRDIGTWRERLDEIGIVVEAFGEEQAGRLPPEARDDHLWDEHARDMMIASHVKDSSWEAISANGGVAWQGVGRMTPDAAAQAIRDILSP